MSSSASTPSTILVDESTSDLINQLKSVLEGIVVDLHEYRRKCQHSSLRDVEEAMKVLKNKVPKDRGELSRKLARCAASLDAIAAIVGPLFQAGKPVAPIVFASIAVILKLCVNRENIIQAIADTFLLIANTLPLISSLSSIQPYNRAVTQVFSGMVRFFVDAAKFLGKNSIPIRQSLRCCLLIVHKNLYRSQLVSSAPPTSTMLALASRTTSILHIS